jgi:hypothetical protein
MCGFPEVRNAREMSTRESKVKAQSTMRRKLGFSDEPGFRISEKKDPVGGDSASAIRLRVRVSQYVDVKIKTVGVGIEKTD